MFGKVVHELCREALPGPEVRFFEAPKGRGG